MNERIAKDPEKSDNQSQSEKWQSVSEVPFHGNTVPKQPQALHDSIDFKEHNDKVSELEKKIQELKSDIHMYPPTEDNRSYYVEGGDVRYFEPKYADSRILELRKLESDLLDLKSESRELESKASVAYSEEARHRLRQEVENTKEPYDSEEASPAYIEGGKLGNIEKAQKHAHDLVTESATKNPERYQKVAADEWRTIKRLWYRKELSENIISGKSEFNHSEYEKKIEKKKLRETNRELQRYGQIWDENHAPSKEDLERCGEQKHEAWDFIEYLSHSDSKKIVKKTLKKYKFKLPKDWTSPSVTIHEMSEIKEKIERQLSHKENNS